MAGGGAVKREAQSSAAGPNKSQKSGAASGSGSQSQKPGSTSGSGSQSQRSGSRSGSGSQSHGSTSGSGSQSHGVKDAVQTRAKVYGTMEYADVLPPYKKHVIHVYHYSGCQHMLVALPFVCSGHRSDPPSVLSAPNFTWAPVRTDSFGRSVCKAVIKTIHVARHVHIAV